MPTEQTPKPEISASTPEAFLEKVFTAEETPAKEEIAPKPILEGDDAPAPGEPASEGTDDSPPEAAEPPIEPPSSWKTEDKAIWPTLPREAQQAIAAREAEREAGVNLRLQEIAGKRAEAEAERKAVLDGRAQLIQQQNAVLATLFPELQALQNIDWQGLAASDPSEYVKQKAAADALTTRIQTAQGYVQELQQKQQEDLTKAARERSATERVKLAAALPVFADPVKGKETAQKLNEFLKAQGYTDEEIAGIGDHRTIKVIYQAWLHQSTENARKAALAKQQKVAPKVVKPGQAQEPEERSAKVFAGKMGALKRHGSIEAAQSLLEDIL